jgi:hypothetical protein
MRDLERAEGGRSGRQGAAAGVAIEARELQPRPMSGLTPKLIRQARPIGRQAGLAVDQSREERDDRAGREVHRSCRQRRRDVYADRHAGHHPG